MIINGDYTDAVIYGNIIEAETISQVSELCNHPAFESASVRIMPDCHVGKGCVIGFTSVSSKKIVIPNVVGVDIGCGILSTVFTAENDIDYKALDDFIRTEIPSSVNVRSAIHPVISSDNSFLNRLIEVCTRINESENAEHHLRSIGTLGGGNHFIEIGRISEREFALFVHTGSRNFGKKICNFYQKHASVFDDSERRRILSKHHTAVTAEEHALIDREASMVPEVSRELAFLTDEMYSSYIDSVIFAREFASVNREIISDSIIDFLKVNNSISVTDRFDTVHNYIDWYDETESSVVVRKGAVSARNGEHLVIPLNMKDGVIIAEGRGNEEWNCSAPHGAGRLLSRSEARRNISLEEYMNLMKDVNTWSVCTATIDEAPQAYKPAEEIISSIADTVNIIGIAKSEYNFKAS